MKTMKPKNLYDVAKMVCHKFGFPWTDPRTLITYPPPKKGKKWKTGTATGKSSISNPKEHTNAEERD